MRFVAWTSPWAMMWRSGTLRPAQGTLKDGTATEGIWVRVTFCFRKLDGDWQIVHDQASVPFDVLSGKGVADLEP